LEIIENRLFPKYVISVSGKNSGVTAIFISGYIKR